MSVMAARERIANALAGSFYDNPVVTKSFRTRMRGWKAFVLMGAYVLLMAVVLMIAYLLTCRFTSSYRPAREMIHMGAVLFGTLTWVQTILLTLIVPALSSGAISYEQEKRTLELLVLTQLSAGKVVLGKQLSSFLYALVLLVCSVPLAGMCLMFGGISPMEIAVTYLLLVAWVFLITCAGVMWSTLCRKTMIASGANFGVCFAYFLATCIVPSIVMQTMGYYGGRSFDGIPFMLLNPAMSVVGVLKSSLVCGIRVPQALVAGVLHVAMGLVFLLMAMSNVRYKPADRSMPSRLIFLGVTALVVWLATGCTRYACSKGAISDFGIWLIVAAMLVACGIGTGAVRKPDGRSMIGYVFSPLRAFKGDIGGSIWFMVLWTVVAWGAFGLASWMQGNAIGRAPNPGKPGFWTVYMHVGVAILVIVAATTAVGVFFSSLAKKRSSAGALVFLFAVAMFAGYVIVALNSPVMTPGQVTPLGRIAALWPLTPVLASTGHWPYDYPAPTKLANAWIWTSLAYAAIGALSILLAGPIFRKTGGVVAEE